MAKHEVSASAVIHAPASQVYAVIADYRDGHPRILPKPYFVDLKIDEGGIGAGTVITFRMKLMGGIQTFHAAITEPEPGRILVETDLDRGAVTTFTVEPCDDGRHANVTITTVTDVRRGILGRIEGWLTTRLLQPIYVKELAQLDTTVMR